MPEMPSEETSRHDLYVDEDDATDAARRPAEGAGLVTPLVLFGGLLLTLLLVSRGIRFFFLPIILPFGLGGGRLVRRLVGSLRRRLLRLEGGELLLLTTSVLTTTSVVGTRCLGTLDATAGVFVSLVPSRLWVNGVQDVTVRIVGATGALAVTLPGSEAARLFRRKLGTLLAEGSVRLLDEKDEEDEAPLQGAVAVRALPDDLGDEPGDVKGERDDRDGLGADEASPIVEISWASEDSGFFRRRKRTWLRFSVDRWALRVRSGVFGATSTGGPGPLGARLIAVREADPFGGVTVRHALELHAEGETVAVVGEELSRPELSFIAGLVESKVLRRDIVAHDISSSHHAD
jgi:hypothetical protein